MSSKYDDRTEFTKYRGRSPIGVVLKPGEPALPPLGVYQHFKGNFYELMGFGRSSETQEIECEYIPLYGPGYTRERQHRSLKMWTETVSRGDYHGPRFVFREPSDASPV